VRSKHVAGWDRCLASLLRYFEKKH
jgi:hypothetical protein